MKTGLTIIISGPSGVGKGTVIKRVLDNNPSYQLSVSTTTRKCREGEKDGVSYNFVSIESFKADIANKQFAEWAEVHGNYYGTPRSTIINCASNNKVLLLEIDVQGAKEIINLFKKQALKGKLLSIFLAPPSQEELNKRIVNRGTESAEVIKKRMTNAKEELNQSSWFDYLAVNKNIEEVTDQVESIILKEINK
jgi:guanylate kinase